MVAWMRMAARVGSMPRLALRMAATQPRSLSRPRISSSRLALGLPGGPTAGPVQGAVSLTLVNITPDAVRHGLFQLPGPEHRQLLHAVRSPRARQLPVGGHGRPRRAWLLRVVPAKVVQGLRSPDLVPLKVNRETGLSNGRTFVGRAKHTNCRRGKTMGVLHTPRAVRMHDQPCEPRVSSTRGSLLIIFHLISSPSREPTPAWAPEGFAPAWMRQPPVSSRRARPASSPSRRPPSVTSRRSPSPPA